MDLLPKQMCHRCSYKLEEFYNFYVDCAKTDTELKSQLSWMRKETLEEKIITPMVKMNRFKIKTEPCDDNMDSNVLGHISESSLLFPASILQHSFDTDASPMLSCTRCQCLCNPSIKMNKSSPKQVEESSNETSTETSEDMPKKDFENEAHGSNVISNAPNNASKLDTPKTVDKDFTLNKDMFEDNGFIEVNKKIPVVNLEVNDCIRSDSLDNTNLFASGKLNRALRPRKGSVDYTSQKKKGLGSNNLKAKLKNKLDSIDPSLVNPVDVKVSQGNSAHSSPVIKLEKVDDTMRTLRTRKNLEEFNKRIKEFKRKRNLHKRENQNKTLFQINETQSTKNFSREERQHRKSLQKEEMVRRKSLQREENLNRKSLQREETQNRKSVPREEILIRKSLPREEGSSRKSVQREESPSKKTSLKEETINRKSPQPDDIPNKKNLQKEENQDENLHAEENQKNEQCLSSSSQHDTNESIMRIPEVTIKQEVVNKTTDSDELMEEQMIQDKRFETNPAKDKRSSKSVDRHLCAVVKLEKDYTCNVDYPRIKIKRQLAVANSSASEDIVLDAPVEASVSELGLDRNSLTNNDASFSPKNLRSKEKRLKVGKSMNKFGKASKKKEKKLDLSVKHAASGKGSSVVSQTDLKRYCEECDTCFRNKELYRLHPCYQK